MTNAETGSASYLSKWKAYEVQSWYADRARRLVSVSPTSAMTSKVKVNVAKSSGPSDRYWPISQKEVSEISKLVRMLPTRREIRRTSFKVKGQGHQATDAETGSASY